MTQLKSNGNGNRHGATDEKVEISTDPISPNSKKIYVNGTLHPDIKVPFREISLSPSTTINSNENGNNGHHKENSEHPSSSMIHPAPTPTRKQRLIFVKDCNPSAFLGSWDVKM